jgi:hypothetical protein
VSSLLDTAFSPKLVQVFAIVFLLILTLAVMLDIALDRTNQEPLAPRVSRWAAQFPWFATGLALFVGMAVAHFFLSPL